jgi:hypothetical protein
MNKKISVWKVVYIDKTTKMEEGKRYFAAHDINKCVKKAEAFLHMHSLKKLDISTVEFLFVLELIETEDLIDIDVEI